MMTHVCAPISAVPFPSLNLEHSPAKAGAARMSTRLLTIALSCATFLVVGATLSAQTPDRAGQHQDLRPRSYPGPPLSLADALSEAAARNSELVALRARVAVVAERPAQ